MPVSFASFFCALPSFWLGLHRQSLTGLELLRLPADRTLENLRKTKSESCDFAGALGNVLNEGNRISLVRGHLVNDFDKRICEIKGSPLEARSIETLQVNVGLLCNNLCVHCHVQAAPKRTELMDWATMQCVLDAARRARPKLVDITGGAPELNPLLNQFVTALREDSHSVQLRTNLTVLLEPNTDSMMKLWRDAQVSLVASLPCYLEKEVNSQRGEGVFRKSIAVLKRLNAMGYGVESALRLDLVYNPEGAFLPPEQSSLEAEYKEELQKNFGIVFNNLVTIANMPVGRFLQFLRERGMEDKYLQLLRRSFNPQTVDKLMCLNQVNVGWNGVMYDCDFNLALGTPVHSKLSQHIQDFDPSRYSKRMIVTGDHCFGCTAGYGSSCSGALVS